VKLLLAPLAGRVSAALALVGAVGVVFLVAVIASPEKTPAAISADLPPSSQAAIAEERQQALPSPDVQPAILVFSRDDGQPLTIDDQSTAMDRATAAAAEIGSAERPQPRLSADGTVLVTSVPVSTVDGDLAVADTVDQIRGTVGSGLPQGVDVAVTGGPAFSADLTKVFDGANTTLLLATAAVVALLLIVTYRSPWLWIVPLVVVGVSEQVTLKVVELLAEPLGLVVDDAATGITSVLVFGAGTDYALLLISRYREQLRLVEDRFAAMRTALARTTEPVVASAGTVIISLLTLLLASQPTTRGLGFSAAVGVFIAMLAALLVLPAAMVLPGRRLFWPFVPRVGDPAPSGTVWERIGRLVARRPAPVALAGSAFLVVLALGGVGLSVGLTQNEVFINKPEAVVGQETLAKSFPEGATAPVAILTNPDAVAALEDSVRAVDGVDSVTAGPVEGRIAQVDVVLSSPPGSSASYDAVEALRSTVASVPGADAVVGGEVAASLDAKNAASRDAKVIIPLVLLLVATALVLLLRSLVGAAILVATVVANYFAAVGLSWWLFSNVLEFPALDTGVLLLSFLFLVALGVDYNIFLVTRAREEARTEGTTQGMLRALRVTGGVITSAGILLAAVFAVLGVLPLIALAQIGTIVCVGVLLDTLLVRTVLVPALTFMVGDRFWWPSRAPEAHSEQPEPALAR
jgi:RND superfamily putative drug exporter